MANTARMTALQRREQLIRVGRALFASKGFEAVSVEEIAANAKVSKPIVYEHFGGKEGLYAVIVDREMRELTNALIEALSDTKAHPRQIVERAALALLTYIEENSEGFQVLVRDSPTTDPAGSFNSLLGDISLRVEDLLTAAFKRRKLSAKGVAARSQGRQRTSRQRAERDNGPGRAGRSCRDRRTGRTGIPARERRLIIRTAHKPEAQKTAERTTGLA